MSDEHLSDEDLEELTNWAEKGMSAENRRSFERHARKAGVKDELLDDAWALGRVDPATDMDDEAMASHVSKFLETRPHFGKAGGKTPADKETAKAQEAAKAGKFVVNRADLSNMQWMQKNQAAYAKAVTDGTVHYTD
jgi:hypothetical protein